MRPKRKPNRAQRSGRKPREHIDAPWPQVPWTGPRSWGSPSLEGVEDPANTRKGGAGVHGHCVRLWRRG